MVKCEWRQNKAIKVECGSAVKRGIDSELGISEQGDPLVVITQCRDSINGSFAIPIRQPTHHRRRASALAEPSGVMKLHCPIAVPHSK
jgi:hypothetical protein